MVEEGLVWYDPGRRPACVVASNSHGIFWCSHKKRTNEIVLVPGMNIPTIGKVVPFDQVLFTVNPLCLGHSNCDF